MGKPILKSKKAGLLTLVLMLIVSSIVVLFSLVTLAPAPVAASPDSLQPHAPIHISGDDGFTEANGVTGGSGTEADPYIIEGWAIDASGTRGIWIEDTTAYFVIRNCLIENASGFYYFGIHLNNVSNGRIENTTCSYNGEGIYIEYSNNIVLENNTIGPNTYEGIHIYSSTNNTIINNTCFYNESEGIQLEGASNNVLRNNLCSNNSDYGIYLEDDSDNNTLEGNTCSNNSSEGIQVFASYNNLLKNNVCSNNDDAGIELSGSGLMMEGDNNVLDGNTCSGNGYYGIVLTTSSKNTLINNTCSNNEDTGTLLQGIPQMPSSYNILRNNTVENNSWTGIFLVSSSDNNTIFLNYLLNNGTNAYDACSNYWDNNGRGNYWSDWLPPAHPDADGDGIVDDPRPIEGGANVDQYPLAAMPSPPDNLRVGYPSADQQNPVNFEYVTPFFSAVNHNGEAVDNYQIQITAASDTGFNNIIWDSGSQSMASTANGSRSPDLFFPDVRLKEGESYRWRIRFEGAGGWGDWSEPATIGMKTGALTIGHTRTDQFETGTLENLSAADNEVKLTSSGGGGFTEIWRNTTNGGMFVAVDSSGYVYATNPPDWPPGGLLYRLESTDGSQVWAYTDDGGYDVAFDSSGNVYFVNMGPPGFGSYVPESRFAKLYGDNGEVAWEYTYVIAGYGVAVDPDGYYVYTTGPEGYYSSGTYKFYTENGDPVFGTDEGGIIPLNGDVLGNDIVVGPPGYVYVTGSYAGQLTTVKLNAETGDVVEGWGPGAGYGGNRMALDPSGDIYVVGSGNWYSEPRGPLHKLRKNDGGVIWSRTDILGSDVAVDPSGDVYVACGDNLVKLSGTDGSVIWAQPAGEGVQFFSVAVDLWGGVYVGGWDEGGEVFVAKYGSAPSAASGVLTSCELDSTDKNITSVTTLWNADVPSDASLSVEVSNDNGASWEQVENNVLHEFSTVGSSLKYRATFSTPDASQTPVLYDITLTYTAGTDIYEWVQTTQGDFEQGTPSQVDTAGSPGDVVLSGTWQEVWQTVASLSKPPGQTTEHSVYTFLETTDGKLFAGTEYGILRSTDGGSTWTQVLSFPACDNRVETIIQALDGSLYATVNQAGVYRSTDGGNNWTNVLSLPYCYSLFQASDGYFYVSGYDGSDHRVWRSSDGQNWNKLSWTPNGAVEKFVQTSSGKLFALADWETYKSSDGVTWDSIIPYGATSFLETSDNLFITASHWVYKSTDGGDTWSRVLENTSFGFRDISKTPDGKLFAWGYGGYPPKGCLYRSTDGGINWSKVLEKTVSTLFITTDGKVFAYVAEGYPSPGYIYRSTDGGSSWTSTQTTWSTYGQAWEFVETPSKLYVIVPYEGKIYRSTDWGNSWWWVFSDASLNAVYTIFKASDGTVFVGAVGKILRLGGYTYQSSGTLTSSVFDASLPAKWGTISWQSTEPAGTSIGIETRSSANGSEWSSWTAATNGAHVPSPDGRYIQYRATLSTTNSGVTPVLHEVRITYAPVSLGPDETAPPAPIGLHAVPDNWTNQNLFLIDWTDPSDPSGIVGTYYKLDSPPTYPTDGIYTLYKPFTVSVGGGQYEYYATVESGTVHYRYTGSYMVRKGPGLEYDVLCYIQAGERYAWTGRVSNGWHEIWIAPYSNQYKGTTGWVYPGTYIGTATKDVVRANRTLTVYKTPGGDAYGEVYSGQRFHLVGTSGDWYKIQMCGDTAGGGAEQGWIKYRSWVSLGTGGDGEHTIYVWLVDGAGNVNHENRASTKLYLDTTPPETPTIISSHSAGVWENDNNPWFEWNRVGGPSPVTYFYMLYGYDEGWENTTDNHVSYSNVPENAYTFLLYAVDTGGRSELATYTIGVLAAAPPPDNEAPGAPINLHAVPSSWTNVDNFLINWTDPSDLSGIVGTYYKLDSPPTHPTDGIYTLYKPFRVSVGSEGQHTIYVWLVDGAGNVNHENRASTKLYLDTTPPEIPTITSPTHREGIWENNPNPSFSWNRVGGPSPVIYHYRLYGYDSDWRSTPNNGVSYSNVPDGVYTFMVWPADAGGLSKSYASYVIGIYTAPVDTTPPDAPANLTATPSSWTNVNRFTVSWTNPSDPSGIAGVYIKLENAPTADDDGVLLMGENVSRITDITVPGEGSWPVYVWLVDGRGNKDHNNWARTTLYFDNTPPTIPTISSTTHQENRWTNNRNPSFSWNRVGGPSPVTYFYMLYGYDNDWQITQENRVSYSSVPDGTYLFVVWPVDAGGPSENYAAYVVAIDAAPPSRPSLVSPENNLSISSATQVFKWSASTDTASGLARYHLQIDNEPGFDNAYMVYENSAVLDNFYTYTFGDWDNYYWRVGAADRAGNESWSGWFKLTAENFNRPPVSWVEQISPYWQTSAPTITATASDPEGDNIVAVALYYRDSPDNSNWGPWLLYDVDTDSSDNWSWPFEAPDGYYEFFSRALDNENNLEPVPMRADTRCAISLEAPQAPINLTVTPSAWTNVNSFTVSWTNPPAAFGIAGCYYKVGSAPESSEDGTFVWGTNITSIQGISVSGDGGHPIYVWLLNGAGKADHNNSASTTLKFDNTPPEIPTISSTTHPEGEWANNRNPSFSWNRVGGPSPVTYFYMLYGYDNDWQTTPENQVSYSDVPNGAYLFLVWPADTGGSSESCASYVIGISAVEGSISGTPPTSSVSPITPYWRTENTFTITAGANDTDGEVQEVGLWIRRSLDNSTWTAWTPYAIDENGSDGWSWPFEAPDGYYEFSSVALDNDGNFEGLPAQAEARYAVDTRPPVSAVNPIAPYLRASIPITLTAQASDVFGVENVELWYRYSSDNSSWSPWTSFGVDTASPWGWSFTAPNGDGYYEFYSRAHDNAGNYEGAPVAADTRCAVDTTAPAKPQNLTATPSSWTNVNRFTLSWTNPSDPSGIAGVYIKLENAPTADDDGVLLMGENVSMITDIQVPGEGSWPVYVWLVDGAGKADHNNRDNVTLHLDTTSPALALPVSPPNGLIDNTSEQIFGWTPSTDDLSGLAGYHLQVGLLDMGLIYDNSAIPDNTVAVTFNHWSTFYWRVRAIDRAGNPSPWSEYFFFDLENFNRPPESSVSPLPVWQNSELFTITATASDPDGDEVENVSLYYSHSPDGLTWSPWKLYSTDDESPWEWTFTSPEGEGYYEFFTVGADNLGNVEHVYMPDVWCVVDLTPPGRPMPISPTSGSATNSTTPTFSWSAVQDLSGMTYVLQIDDDSDFSSPAYSEAGISGTTRQVKLPKGTWYWRVRATDGAGNQGMWSDMSVLTIRTVLLAPVSLSSPGATPADVVTISWSPVEGATGYVVEFAGYQYPTSNPWLTLRGLPEGEYDWRVRAITSEGGVGRSGWTDMQSLWVDRAPPSILNFTINSAASSTTSARVTLSLSAFDLGSGVYEMRFSNDGVKWSDWEPFAPSKSYTLPPGEGLKTVYAMVRDRAGLVSEIVSYSIAVGKSSPAITSPHLPSGVLTAAIGAIPAGSTGFADFSGHGIAVTGVRITAAEGLQNVEVNVAVRWTPPEGVTAPDLPVYSYFDISTNVDPAKISGATIEFKVPRSWMDQMGINVGTVRLLRYEGGWQEQPTTLLNSDADYCYFEATTSGFSVFGVVGQMAAPPAPGPEPVAGAGLPLLPLVVGLAVAIGAVVGALWATGRLRFGRPKVIVRRVKGPTPLMREYERETGGRAMREGKPTKGYLEWRERKLGPPKRLKEVPLEAESELGDGYMEEVKPIAEELAEEPGLRELRARRRAKREKK